MRRLKTASLAILGAAAIFAFGPAMAKETMAKGKMTKGEITKGETTKAEVTPGGSKTLAKGQRHMQRHVATRGERFRNANAAMTRENQSGRPLGPVGAASPFPPNQHWLVHDLTELETWWEQAAHG